MKIQISASTRLQYIIAALLLVSSSWPIILPAAPEEIRDIPNPRLDGGWVVDLTGEVDQQDIDRINSFCDSVNQTGGVEMAVVMIQTTDGKPIEDFAEELFKLWGIGRKTDNEGLLFLVAKQDRAMRIALGSGVDGSREEKIAQEVLDEEVTPRFKRNEFGEGLYAGSFSAALRILNLAENEFSDQGFARPESMPAATAANLVGKGNRPAKAKHVENVKRKNPAPWIVMLIGGGLVAGLIAIIGGRRWKRYRNRDCERCFNEMVRLQEDQDDLFLDDGEQTEERVGSVDYDVWACRRCEYVTKHRYGRFFTKYSRCPSCNYKTKFEIRETIRSATTSRGGRVKVQEQCVQCDYSTSRYYSTPKLSSSNSGRGGGSFSGSGFSGGRSSGGFSGGSTRGGGATGSW